MNKLWIRFKTAFRIYDSAEKTKNKCPGYCCDSVQYRQITDCYLYVPQK